MKVLVTGGAGYIGSHVVRLLAERGDTVIVADDMSAGVSHRIAGFESLHLDLSAPGAQHALTEALDDGVDAVIHLAARKKVGESVELPEWYFEQNVGGMAHLLGAMRTTGVTKLVFSSSAATYGMPDVPAVTEDTVCNPINPYGETKLIGEWMVANASRAWGLRGANLRYFNVAGAGWPDLGDTAVANLVPIVFAALRAGTTPVVFGDDYSTPDGSCVRDYVHVHDLAAAHLAALDYLDTEERPHATFNVGTGTGSSVFEVLDTIRQVTGIDFPHEVSPRRAGDPPYLCADISRITNTLGWTTQYGLRDIIASAWDAAAT